MLTRIGRLAFLIGVLLVTTVACGILPEATQTAAPTDVVQPVPTQTAEPSTTTPPTSTATIMPEPTPEENNSQYWVEVQDYRTGIRFAIPCFWLAHIPEPEQDPSGLGSFAITNYPYEYVRNFPRSVIPEDAGAVKIDILFFEPTDWGSPPGVSMVEFVNTLYSDNTETQLISTEELQVNGQPAVLVTTESIFGLGQFYLFKHSDEIFVGFGPGRSVDNADTQNILNTLAITPEVAVSLPNDKPGPPPVGLAAECIPGYEVAVQPTVEIPEVNTECGLHSFKSLEYLVESVQQRLQDRNTGGLRWEYFINDPMTVGYWASEGVVMSPDEFATIEVNENLRVGGCAFGGTRVAFVEYTLDYGISWNNASIIQQMDADNVWAFWEINISFADAVQVILQVRATDIFGIRQNRTDSDYRDGTSQWPHLTITVI